MARDNEILVSTLAVSTRDCSNSAPHVKKVYVSTKGISLKIWNVPFIKLSYSVETSVAGNDIDLFQGNVPTTTPCPEKKYGVFQV